MLGRPPIAAIDCSRPAGHALHGIVAAAGADDGADDGALVHAGRRSCGKTSPIWMPGTLVAIGLNSPRISTGASVLMSHMSWCGGPPPRKMLMTALCWLVRAPARASARKMSARVRLAAPKVKGADLQEAAAGDAVAELRFPAEEGQHGVKCPFRRVKDGGRQR